MAQWTPDEISIALEMHDSGAPSYEIGLRFGRSPPSVRGLLRRLGVSKSREQWMAQFTGEASAYCPEQKRFHKNAIEGSAKLRDALFGLVA